MDMLFNDAVDIGNELADVFGQIIRIADYYNIDLLEAHIAAREDEDRCLTRMNF